MHAYHLCQAYDVLMSSALMGKVENRRSHMPRRVIAIALTVVVGGGAGRSDDRVRPHVGHEAEPRRVCRAP